MKTVSSRAGEHERDEFLAFARSLGAVARPIEAPPPVARPASGRGTDGVGKKALTAEYQQMVRDARTFFGDRLQGGLTAMLAPYGVTDTHALTQSQCAEISEKIEIMQALAALPQSASEPR